MNNAAPVQSQNQAAPTAQQLEFNITGMTCAACANRIEKKLNRLDGVTATVNYAVEKAYVEADPQRTAMIIETVSQLGYGAQVYEQRQETTADLMEHTAVELRALKRRTIFAGVLTVPVVLISMIPALQFDYWGWIVGALATPVVFGAGFTFHRAAFKNLRRGATTMDTLVSAGTLAAYLWSMVALVFGTAGHPGVRHELSIAALLGAHGGTHGALSDVYFEVAAGVIFFILLGRLFEKRAKKQSAAALTELSTLAVREVTVMRGDEQRVIAVTELRVGDHFVVLPGQQVATDGVVVTGHSAVDAALITGEAAPVSVGPGSSVVGATVNTTGRLVVRATAVGSETQLAQMAQLLEQAQAQKAELQRLADKISGIFVPVTMFLAVLTLGVWLLLGASVAAALSAAMTVLIIACPCALGLATPTALLVGTGRGAALGIMISGPVALERAARLDNIIFDKTGTLTTGNMALAAVAVAPDVSRETIFKAVVALESYSEHPAGKALVNGLLQELREAQPRLAQESVLVAEQDLGAQEDSAAKQVLLAELQGLISEFEVLPGRGVTAKLHVGEDDPHPVYVGNAKLFRELDFGVDPTLSGALESYQNAGYTVVLAGSQGVVSAVFGVSDRLRDDSVAAVQEIVKMGIEPVLLTGDNERAAAQIAGQLGITRVIAGALPADKISHVKALQEQGQKVVMVGDGINDAAALAQADLGIAMGAGTDAAQAAADIVIVNSKLADVTTALRLARRTQRTIVGNLFWAFAYNTAAIPLAAFGLLNPMLAGAAMALSSVFVVANSLRLRSFK